MIFLKEEGSSGIVVFVEKRNCQQPSKTSMRIAKARKIHCFMVVDKKVLE